MVKKVININLSPLTPAQLSIKRSNKRFTIAMCGRRFGKSLLAQSIIIEKLLVTKNIMGYICPTFDLCRKFFDEIISIIPPELVTSTNRTELQLTTIKGSVLKFFSGLEPDRLRGWSLDYLVIDEAAYIDELEDKWNSVYRVLLADRKGHALFISTPRGLSFFTALYNKGLDDNEEEFKSFRYTTFDNPHIPKEEIEMMAATMPKAKFDQEILALPTSNADAVFSDKNINENIIYTLSTSPPVILAADVAKKHDYTVITGLDSENVMCYFDRFQLPWAITKERIISVKQSYPDTLLVMDSTGAGDVIYEQVSEVVGGVIGHQFTAQNKPKIIYNLMNNIEKNNIKYNEITANEMKTFEYKLSSTGQPLFNAISGYYDDCISALALANWYKNEADRQATWQLY